MAGAVQREKQEQKQAVQRPVSVQQASTSKQSHGVTQKQSLALVQIMLHASVSISLSQYLYY